MSEETNNYGAELGGLAKLLFDKAVCYWYSAIFIEIIAGGLAVIAGIVKWSDKFNILFAMVGFLLLALAYYLKEKFHDKYDDAETMRRQSVLSLSMAWSISKTKMSEWRRCCGPKIASRDVALESGYYETKEAPSPKKLLEITEESVFWTRHLYNYLRNYVLVGLLISVILLVFVLTFTASDVLQGNISLKIIYAIYLILPIALSIDMFGWFLRLNRLSKNMWDIERDLESLGKESTINDRQILILVAEYNCQVISGFPIPSWFFRIYHDSINNLWKKR